MKKSQIRKIIQEELEDFLGGYEGGDFDSFEFKTSAKDSAQKDIESSGQDFEELGDSKYEKNLDPKDFVSDLERANLRLPSDEKELDDIQKGLDKKKKQKDSVMGFSLNEDKSGNYMTPQNLKNIKRAAEFLLTKIDSSDQIEDWVEDKISKVAENMRSLDSFYKDK